MTEHPLDLSLAEELKQTDANGKVDALFEYMRRKGNTNYDENVTQLQHGLQSAALARSAGATPQQVISALFHDLGHLLVDEHAGEGDFLEEDLNHEEVGAEYLRPFFPPEVIVPIELHVPAKRYLCTVDDSYYNGLSESSKQSFRVQGGKMSDEEKAAFEDTPHLQFACQLRRWDDGGKQGGLEVPDLEAYRDDCLASLL